MWTNMHWLITQYRLVRHSPLHYMLLSLVNMWLSTLQKAHFIVYPVATNPLISNCTFYHSVISFVNLLQKYYWLKFYQSRILSNEKSNLTLRSLQTSRKNFGRIIDLLSVNLLFNSLCILDNLLFEIKHYRKFIWELQRQHGLTID
jgi:hypothetical protein